MHLRATLGREGHVCFLQAKNNVIGEQQLYCGGNDDGQANRKTFQVLQYTLSHVNIKKFTCQLSAIAVCTLTWEKISDKKIRVIMSRITANVFQVKTALGTALCWPYSIQSPNFLLLTLGNQSWRLKEQYRTRMNKEEKKGSVPWRGRRALMRGKGEGWTRPEQVNCPRADSPTQLKNEEASQRRPENFGDKYKSVPESAKTWSRVVWKSNEDGDDAGNTIGASGMNKPAIGLGRATGFSRVPDAALSGSMERMKGLLVHLEEQVKVLERDGYALICLQKQRTTSKPTIRDAMAAWEPILAEYRQLTMAVTAASRDDSGKFAIRAYEGAADACLLAGNLSFYLACQTRLLSDLYEPYPDIAIKRSEFIGYAILYFGVFCIDYLELARMMRVLTEEGASCSAVRFAFDVVTAYRTRNGPKFLSLFQRGNIRQRTILSSAVEPMEKLSLSQLIRSYMTLDKDFAVAQLRLCSRTEFFDLLQSERPDLIPENIGESSEYQLRVRQRKAMTELK